MSFWNELKASKQAYYGYINSRRSERISFSSIDSTLGGLEKWKNEFQSLTSAAHMERNSAAALSQLNDMLEKISKKQNQLLDLRSRQSEKRRRLEQKIERLEQSINNIEKSLNYDHQKMGRLTRKNGNAWRSLREKIQGKEEKIRNMKSSLSDLRIKIQDL